MATVRITGNWRNPNKMEFGGTLEVDTEGQIERTLQIPEEVYLQIEDGIAKNVNEGTITQEGGVRYNWFVDR